MGTRGHYRIIEKYTTNFKNKVEVEETTLVSIYNQYDNYPTGVPLQVAEFLSKGKVVNGFGAVDNDEIVFNGAGCLAAQVIKFLKKGVGGAYIVSPDSRGESGEDYLFDIVVDGDKHLIEFAGYENAETPKEFFRGTLTHYYHPCA
jgi:hypothetical protein